MGDAMNLVEERTLRVGVAYRSGHSGGPSSTRATFDGGQNVRVSMLCLFAPMLVASGCSLTLDSERHQCDEVADCAAIFNAPAAAYTCVNNLCQTYRECTDNASCANAPGKPYCVSDKCVACTEKAQCVNANTSNTMDCVANACVDPVWGCLGVSEATREADNRPPATEPTATFKVMAKDPLADPNGPAPYPMGLTAVLCKAPSVEAACVNPLPGTTPSYDVTTGTLTLANVQKDLTNLHLRFTGQGQTYLPVEYYTTRSARDTTTVEDVNFVPANVFGSIMDGDKKVDPTKASINVRVHDCAGNPAANVELVSSQQSADLLHSYVDGRAPRFDLKETQAAGIAGLFNAPPAVNTTLTLNIKAFNPPRSLTYSFAPQGSAVTVIDFYPRK